MTAAVSDDGGRPHRFPKPPAGEEMPGDELIAWRCAACGAIVNEYRPEKVEPCPIDWRRPA